jgi:redox-sensing transcriptional repressor
MLHRKIPEKSIARLCLYLRALTELVAMRIHTISSAELGVRTSFSVTQVRKDLAYFGQFGVTGAGYNTAELKTALEKILGKNKTWNVAVVGVGHLGAALLSYPGFKEHGLTIVSAFDADERKIGQLYSNITVKALSALAREVKDKKISIGIIAVPAKNAQDAASKLTEAGIECILNFAPAVLRVAKGIKLKSVDLSRELESLSYYLTKRNGSRS